MWTGEARSSRRWPPVLTCSHGLRSTDSQVVPASASGARLLARASLYALPSRPGVGLRCSLARTGFALLTRKSSTGVRRLSCRRRAGEARSYRRPPPVRAGGGPVTLSPANEALAAEIISWFPRPRSALIPLLHLAQEQDGYLTDDAMRRVGELVGATPAEVKGTAGFYEMFRFEPVGTYHDQRLHQHLLPVCGAARNCWSTPASRSRNRGGRHHRRRPCSPSRRRSA